MLGLSSARGFAGASGTGAADRRWTPLLSVAFLVCLLAGCAGPSRLAAVPSKLTDEATALGIPNARFWADTQGPEMVQEARQALAREDAAQGTTAAGGRATANYLAISGGSDNGAFGAGLLVGWTETGTRPEFKLVTGISTGALIAPFAFLGPAYDAQLRAVYTGIGPKDVYEQRWLPTAIFSDALTDTDPLFHLIARYANQDMLDRIAAEYRKGRLLLIGTTNLDVQRPVIWNIGAIAASGRPGALDLFRKILLASASVPGVFPPVLIDVDAGGGHYQEMHVDGGAVAQTFLIPSQVGTLVNLNASDLARRRVAYIIRNARLDPEWASVDRRLLSITGRAISTMIHYSGYNDVVRIYFTCKRDGVEYNLAYIGDDFSFEHKQNFDTAYMRALFEYGLAEARSGTAWKKAPPILAEPDGEERLNTTGTGPLLTE
ncbi:MAG TPA: patatin-like phospholipase family protein [Acetobacteraceae bacterium]|nr:patatin-like phospholipase family protein [Acetobacteraceae bacterium]